MSQTNPPSDMEPTDSPSAAGCALYIAAALLARLVVFGLLSDVVPWYAVVAALALVLAWAYFGRRTRPPAG